MLTWIQLWRTQDLHSAYTPSEDIWQPNSIYQPGKSFRVLLISIIKCYPKPKLVRCWCWVRILADPDATLPNGNGVIASRSAQHVYQQCSVESNRLYAAYDIIIYQLSILCKQWR